MLTSKLQKLVVTALEDIKGRDIEVINTSKLSSMFERIVIASADSTRQVKALARHVQDKVLEAGGTVLSLEGEDSGEWVLVDLDSIVVHVMQPGIRSYYNLEELWKTSPKKSLASPALVEGAPVTKEAPAGRKRALAGPQAVAEKADSLTVAPRRRRVAAKPE